jgi:hypothetical protein
MQPAKRRRAAGAPHAAAAVVGAVAACSTGYSADVCQLSLVMPAQAGIQ